MKFFGQSAINENSVELENMIDINCNANELGMLSDKMRECQGIAHTLQGLSRVLIESYQCCDLTKSEIMSLTYVIEEYALNLHKKLGALESFFK